MQPTSRRPARGLAIIAALTPVGVIAAHLGAYWLAYTDPGERAHVLAAAGHDYFEVAAHAALVAALAAVLVQAFAGVRARLGLGGTSTPGLGALWRTLLPVQLAAFVGVEIMERAASSALDGLLTEPAVWLALPLIAVSAGLCALVLRIAGRVAESISPATAPSGAPRRAVFSVPLPQVHAPRSLVAATGGARAPPA